MLEKLLFCLPPDKHSEKAISEALTAHPEIRFVSLVGVDNFGNDTDEKIPINLMMENYEEFIRKGVQTDGSAVLLPNIAVIENARVDLVPDKAVNWYIDYNFDNLDENTNLPVGTLRIPSFLIHNDTEEVGSRSILRDAESYFKMQLLLAMEEHPYIYEHLPIKSINEIEEIKLTSATEMEFYVKTPHEVADKDRLHTSQELKEQYWKRTVGPVRTALENTIKIMNLYGFNVEMGHKEVGGIKAELGEGGFDHIMEQIEIDWKYSSPMQTADNDIFARYIIKDVFRQSGLDVTFMAKPVDEVAGSGKHTHFGVAAKLKNGKTVNLFTALDTKKDYLSPIGFGAIMGILKNYEIINPIVSCTNDAFRRLKPGYEAPVCIVTSLGHTVEVPSRNRTVLVGLIRDMAKPLATRFELRSPNPKSNTYLVEAVGFMAMIDGIKAVLAAEKTSEDLEKSISKEYGDEDFYLETERVYRAENNIFDDYTEAERAKLFGKTPATVWDSTIAFEEYPEKTSVLLEGDVLTAQDLNSFITAAVSQWSMELHDRIIPDYRARIASIVKVNTNRANSLDIARWNAIESDKDQLIKDTEEEKSITTLLCEALEYGLYDQASELFVLIQKRVERLESRYNEYKKNLN